MYDIETFIQRRSGDREPVHDWKWKCLSLPFGMDVDYCESVDLPKPAVAQKDLFGAGTFTYYAGFVQIGTFDCMFYEDVSFRTADWLTGWRNKIRDPETGAYGLPPEYKYNIEFGLYDTTGKMILKAVAKNCFPTTEGNWSLNYTGGNGLLKTNVSFSTDRVDFKRA